MEPRAADQTTERNYRQDDDQETVKLLDAAPRALRCGVTTPAPKYLMLLHAYSRFLSASVGTVLAFSPGGRGFEVPAGSAKIGGPQQVGI